MERFDSPESMARLEWRPTFATVAASSMISQVAETPAASRSTEMDELHRRSNVFTAPIVAAALLDAVAWTADRDLSRATLLEPACGDGAFLIPAAQRLLASMDAAGEPLVFNRLGGRIVAFEIDEASAEEARVRVAETLRAGGVSASLSGRLARRWVRHEDFLLARGNGTFSHVVANPPYLRWSRVPAGLKERYENVLPRHVARGDLSLAFLWKALGLTDVGGGLAFLFPDRWLRSKYGEEVRRELDGSVSLVAHLEAHDLPVFLGTRKVETYPAVSVFRVGGHRTFDTTFRRVASVPELVRLCRRIGARAVDDARTSPPVRSSIARSGGALVWDRDASALVYDLCQRFPTVKQAGITVRCGTALGLKEAFVVTNEDEVEKDRLVPFVRSGDITPSIEITPSAWLANPWTDAGELVDLADFPLLSKRLLGYRDGLEARACVRTSKEWFRTIDKVRPELVASEKIIVAGMSTRARFAVSFGGCQPSNALYSIHPGNWPLDRLARLFTAGALDVFAAVLAPRLRNGSKRFDGYVLGQVRLPKWEDLCVGQRSLLDPDRERDDVEVLAGIYGITCKRALRSLRALVTA